MLLYSVQAFPLLAPPKQRLEPWFHSLAAVQQCVVDLPAPQYYSVSHTRAPRSRSGSTAGRQLSCQGHFWPWLPPVQLATASGLSLYTAAFCRPLPLLHYTALLHCLYVGAIWPNTTMVASLAWHSSACSTVCILYYTASRSRMVSYFDLADCAELCVGLRRINGPNFFIDIPTLCGRCRDLIITTASAKATVHCALMYDNCCHYLYLFM